MQLASFNQEMARLKIVYGEKAFPDERERLMFRRFERVPIAAFTAAVDWVILSMPTASNVIVVLDDKLRDAKVEPISERREIVYTCAPCRDWGFVWEGELIVHCKCEKAKAISWKELERHQRNYDYGKILYPRPKLAALMKEANTERDKRNA